MRTQTSIGTIALIRSLTIAVLTVITITACQDRVNRSSVSPTSNSTSSSNECRNFEHEMGTTKVCGQPQRIVVLGPYYLDPLLSLGVQPVAYADHAVLHQGDYYDRPSQQIPYVGDRITQPIANVGLAYNPSIEAMVKVKPDLIIGSNDMNAQQYETFDQIAPTLLLKWNETEANLRTIAKSVNRSQKAERVWQEHQRRIAATRKKLAPLVAKYPKVLVIDSEQLQYIELVDSTVHCGSILEELGFKLVLPPGWVESNFERAISLEILPQLNEAELIILLSDSSQESDGSDNSKQSKLPELKQAWSENAIAQSLDASKAGRVYSLPSYLCFGFHGAIGTELYLEKLKQQLLPSQVN
jgi:iron complex transport system substrate-binding protein